MTRFDILAIAGLALVATGLWLVAPAASLVVTGLLLLAGAALGARH